MTQTFNPKLSKESRMEIRSINKARKEAGLRPYVVRDRQCLSCKTKFESWSSANRICSNCRPSQTYEGIPIQSFADPTFNLDLGMDDLFALIIDGVSWSDYLEKKFY